MKSLIIFLLFISSQLCFGQKTSKIHIYRPHSIVAFLSPIKIKVNGQKITTYNNRSYQIDVTGEEIKITAGLFFHKKLTISKADMQENLYLNLKQKLDARLGITWQLEVAEQAQREINRIEKRHPTRKY